MFGFASIAALMPGTMGSSGSHNGDPDQVFVCVVSEEDLTPVASTPSSVDSPDATESKMESEPPKPDDALESLCREAPDAPPKSTEAVLQEEPEKERVTERAEENPRKDRKESSESAPQAASNEHKRRAALGRELRTFQSLLLAAIREATFFPRKALKKRRHGEVTVSFTINRDGTLAQVSVVGSCGSEALDKAAVEIIRKASEKFPEFPGSVLAQSLEYTVPILFKRKRSPRTARAAAAR